MRIGWIFLLVALALWPMQAAYAMDLPCRDLSQGDRAPMLRMINAMRAQVGLAPVQVDALLSDAALRHGCDMRKRGFFDHRSPEGATAMTRVRRGGYHACLVAENLARGQHKLRQVIADWLKSPPHRRALYLRDVTEIGLARVDGAQGRPLWVLVLASGCEQNRARRWGASAGN